MDTSYFGLAATQNLKNNPEIFDLSNLDEQLAKARKERQGLNEKNDELKPKPTANAEYDQLQRRLFKLRQAAEGAKIHLDNVAGAVRLLEQYVEKKAKQKKAANRAGNNGAENTYGNQLAHLESELEDAKKNLKSATIEHDRAAAAVASFDGHERIAELKALIEVQTTK
jgi:hypothetical protein